MVNLLTQPPEEESSEDVGLGFKVSAVEREGVLGPVSYQATTLRSPLPDIIQREFFQTV